MIVRFLLFLTFALLGGVASAADIEVHEFQGVPIITVSGPMVNDDVERFRAVVAGVSSGTVLLNSNGGSLYAGIEIGKAIRMRGLATWVSSQQGPCMSACSFAWVAGTPRMLDKMSQVGFHAAYVWEAGKPVTTGSGNALVGAYLRDLGLSESAIFYATDAKPDAMKFLSSQDAVAIGLSLKYLDAYPVSDLKESTWQWATPKGDVPTPTFAPRNAETANTPLLSHRMEFVMQTRGDAEALLYEQMPSGSPKLSRGRVTWWTVSASSGLMIEARVVFPEKGFGTNIRIQQAGNEVPFPRLVWDFRFSDVGGTGFRVTSVDSVAFKQTESERGIPMSAVPVKAGNDAHRLELADTTQSALEIARMSDGAWIDVLFTLSSGNRGLITIEKGIVGDRVFIKGLSEWTREAEVHTSSEEDARPAILKEWRYSHGFFFKGRDENPGGTQVSTMSSCRSMCELANRCVAYSIDLLSNLCFLKKEVDIAVPAAEFSSGHYTSTPVAFQR